MSPGASDTVQAETPESRFLAGCVEVEQAVLGTLLMNNEAARYYGRLRAEHFSEPLHRRIYELAMADIEAGKHVSPLTLRTRLVDQDITPDVSVSKYLARLAANGLPAMCADSYADIAIDLAMRRAMIDKAEDFVSQAREATGSKTAEVASALLSELQAIAAAGGTEDTRREIGASAAALIERVDLIRKGELVDEGVSTGFTDLDRDTGGYRPGRFWLVAGRPGMGKTAFLTSTSRRVAQGGSGVLEFSMEIAEEEIIARHLADLAYRSSSPLSFGQILRGQVAENDIWCLQRAQEGLAELPLIIDVAPSLAITEITARIRQEKENMARAGRELKVVLIDYLTFIKASDRYSGHRVYEIGEISRALKQLAKTEHLCVVLLAQLNRALESRENKRPVISDLRDSGDLEQDADVVLLLYRDEYYVLQSPEYGRGEAYERFEAARNKIEFIIGKNRGGPTRTLPMWCDVAASSIAGQARGI